MAVDINIFLEFVVIIDISTVSSDAHTRNL